MYKRLDFYQFSKEYRLVEFNMDIRKPGVF